MQIELKQLQWLPACLLTLPILQAGLDFSAFGILQPLSYLIWGLCILACLVVGYFYLRYAEMTFLGLVVSVYLFFLLASTLFNGTSLKMMAYQAVDCLLMLMLLAYYRANLRPLILFNGVIFSSIVYANLALMILFPSWIFAADNTFHGFLLGGNYNQMGCRLICAVITSLLCHLHSKWWAINTTFLFIASIVSLLLVGSMTSVSGIIILALFCLIPTLRLQKLALIALVSFTAFFQVFVCFNGNGLHNNEFAVYIVEDVLNKDITFTHRTDRWEEAANVFVDSPTIGYGAVDTEWYLTHMSSQAIGPHNFIWAVLVNGGVVLLALFLIIMGLAFRRIIPCFDRDACVLCMGTVTMFFMMLMEVYPTFFVFYLLALIYYYPEISASLKPVHDNTLSPT